MRDKVQDKVPDKGIEPWPGLLGLGGVLSLTLLFPPLFGLLQSGGPPWGEPVAYQYFYAMLLLTLLVAWMRRPGLIGWAGLGLLAGVGGLIRPPLMFYGMVTLAFGTWVWLRGQPWRSWSPKLLSQVMLGWVLFAVGGGLLWGTNLLRFGDGFEFGHRLNLSSAIYATRFPHPFQDTSLVAAARELFGALFLTRDFNGYDFYREGFAHVAMTGMGLGFAGGEAFVEPDLLQDWPYPLKEKAGLGAGDACEFEDQAAELPRVTGIFAWHQGAAFSELRKARLLAGVPGANGRIRIVHLDTGYDRSHQTFPAHWRESLQRNFIDKDRPSDASDPGAEGLLKNPGHGTGTLSILAGNKFRWTANGYTFDDFVGGAPEAEIIPVRVGRSVVQLLTSSVAAGISYAAELCGSEATRVHVISMSMGGVASQAWADAVNKAYEAGIVYVAAAGNNFSAGFFGVPTRFIVYPARFRRVIAACGVMADSRPYYGLRFGDRRRNPPGAGETFRGRRWSSCINTPAHRRYDPEDTMFEEKAHLPIA